MYLHRPPKSALYKLLGNSLNLETIPNSRLETRTLKQESYILPILDVAPGGPAGNRGRLTQNMWQVCLWLKSSRVLFVPLLSY